MQMIYFLGGGIDTDNMIGCCTFKHLLATLSSGHCENGSHDQICTGDFRLDLIVG